MTMVAPSVPPRRRIGAGTMGAYGFGSVAYGVKDSGASAPFCCYSIARYWASPPPLSDWW